MSGAAERSRGGASGSWPIIAIDGGAGTGKTTSAARVAEQLGFCYIDSGAVYRAIALAMKELGEDDPMSPEVPAVVKDLALRIEPTPQEFRVFLGRRELGLEIRSPEISRLASQLSVRPQVRDKVSLLLREAARLGPLVVEGRDIGTVVFPHAALKVFLSAELPVRAERRHLDLLRQGREQTVEQVARELAERDARDSSRATAPLRPADDALIIDTSAIDIEQQVNAILEGYRRAVGDAGA